jgi:oligopeptidase A
MRQLGSAELDFALHDDLLKRSNAEGCDADKLYEFARTIMYSYSIARADYATLPANFGHLFNDPAGYACGYYSYKWAEVLEADVYSRFVKEGIFNSEVGAAVVREIFEAGSERPGMESFRAFMGREIDSKALLRRDGFL